MAMAVNKVVYGGETIVDLTTDTVTAETMLRGTMAHDKTGMAITGTIDEVEAAPPSITVSDGGVITASVDQEAGYVPASTKAATMELATKGEAIYTPTTTDQTISAGQYLTGPQTIQGDANLVPENIAEGVSIFGVVGTCAGGGDLPFNEIFQYSGNATYLDDGDGNWRIKFLSSGTLSVLQDVFVDVFAVGGGGNGGTGDDDYNSAGRGGGGGGGGYTTTISNQRLLKGEYIVTVGAALGASSLANNEGTVFCEAAGGKSGTTGANGGKGGDGGSGGGPGRWSGVTAGKPGSDGSDGTDGATSGKKGIGQGTTTREFGEETGDLYSGGGGGGGSFNPSGTKYAGIAGADGGGKGGGTTAIATNGAENTGGGGGGGAGITGITAYGKGGSGIVIIRNFRLTTS